MKLARSQRREMRPMTSGDWTPFGGLNRLHHEINRLFEEPLGRWLSPATSMSEEWFPAVDVFEDKDNVRLKAELPGMRKEDIHLSVVGDMLHISGERKEEKEFKDAESCRTERCFGSFQRSIPMPAAVQADQIHAEYKDGILNIVCPKSEEAKKKQIEVKVD